MAERKATKKIALVTGSGSGIGFEVSVRLLEEGFDLISHYHRSYGGVAKLRVIAKELGRELTVVRSDFSKPKSFAAFLKVLKKTRRQASFSAVVHCAGFNEKKQFPKITLSDYDRVLDINFRAPLFITQDLVRRSLMSKNACIVYVGSSNSFIGGGARNTLYTASKTALLGLTKNLAKELAPNIRVNCVIPGYIATRMLYENSTPANLREKRARVPMSSFGEPKDVADTVAFLVSADASYITGQSIHIDGGLYGS